jgi:hypothetical protein
MRRQEVEIISGDPADGRQVLERNARADVERLGDLGHGGADRGGVRRISLELRLGAGVNGVERRHLVGVAGDQGLDL